MFGFGGKCLKAMKDNSNSYTAKIRQLSETTNFFLLNETNKIKPPTLSASCHWVGGCDDRDDKDD